MIVIACVDNNMGMLFNQRRQSQDRGLREKILQRCEDHKLWMNAYSYKQFEEQAANKDITICVAEDFLTRAEAEDYCFVENADVANCSNEIEQIILYCWNRDYPADFYFTVPVHSKPWRLVSLEDFCGSSHEKITEEVYSR